MSKKMYCLLLAFVMLLAVTAVSAADDIDDASLTTDDSTEEIAVDEIVEDVAADDTDDKVADEKLDPNLDINATVSDYGYVSINVTTEKNATGTVTVNVTNSTGSLIKDATGTLVNGSYYLPDLGSILAKGEYNISVFYTGDGNYTNATKVTQLSIVKSIPELKVNASVDNYGLLKIVAILNTNATGNVTFNIVRKGDQPDPKNATSIEIIDGNATFAELYRLEKKDTYDIYVKYEGDKNYYAIPEYHTNITSEKEILNPTESINVTGKKVNVTVDLGAPAEGNVTVVYPSGYTENVTIKNRIVNIYAEFPKEQGNLTFVLDYDGDDNYYGFYEYYVDFFIKYDSNLTVKSEVNKYGQIVIDASVNKTATGNLTFIIYNSTGGIVANVTKTIENGSASYDELTPFAKDNYTFEVIFTSKDGLFENTTYGIGEANVTKEVPDLDVYSISVNNYGQIKVLTNVTKAATGTVTYTIIGDNVNITVDMPVVNGTANFEEINQFDKGDYKIFVEYNGDKNYYSTFSINSTSLSKNQINASEDIKVAGNQATITINLAKATGNVTVYFLNYGTNQTYNITNGTVKFDEIFDNGNQSILVTYDGDANYYGFYEYYIDFYVKASSFISANPVTVVYQKNGVVTVTLTDNNDNGTGKNPVAGVNVTVTLNGKQYFGVTDAKGIATITIPANLVPKEYTATVSYAGNATCNGDNNTFKFTVTKATPKITAKKKTFKAKKKVKKYSVVLKAGKNPVKNVKVTLKIKGKKAFTAKTNAKGKATFKITKLTKKGKYKAVIKSKANSYYKAAAKKKVKITIK